MFFARGSGYFGAFLHCCNRTCGIHVTCQARSSFCYDEPDPLLEPTIIAAAAAIAMIATAIAQMDTPQGLEHVGASGSQDWLHVAHDSGAQLPFGQEEGS